MNVTKESTGPGGLFMRNIDDYEAKTHLSRLLDRVAQGESLTITRHGHPVARLVPAEDEDRKRAERAARRITARRRRLKRASVAELIGSIHEGHRF